jgi:predicted dehydrogenase
MKRRTFLNMGVMATSASLFHIGCVGFGRSRARQIADGAKIRIGAIGCGGRMCASRNYGLLNNFCDEEIVCVCDPDPSRIERARKIVRERKSPEDAARITAYYDYREMLEKEGRRLDAVIISTPNHHHAIAAIMAMNMGLHVYVEKPMALTIEEVRLMHDVAKRNGVVTQVGNHGHSMEGMRRLVEYVEAGRFGQIRDVYCFDDRLNAMPYRPPASPAPKGMDWDLWCGPAPVCEYYAPTKDHGGMHPHDWHSWVGYGNGSIGNMGTHIIDPVFWALHLGESHPESVIADEVLDGCEGSWSCRTTIRWRFPARKGFEGMTLHWYDGVKDGISYDSKHVDRIGCCLKREYQNLPPIVEEVEKKYGVELGALGALFVGEKGFVRIGPHGDALVFAPKDLYKSKPPKTIPREKGLNHQTDWLRSIRNPDRPTGCNFDYSAPLAEIVLLGNVAGLAGKGKELLWNGDKIVNNESANVYLKTSYRTGWNLF